MSYQFYKLLHFGSILLFLASASVTLLFPREQVKKYWKILIGVAALTIFVSGYGLLAKSPYLMMGTDAAGNVIKANAGTPWVLAKQIVWGILFVGGHVVAIKMRQHAWSFYYVIVFLLILNTYFAVFKPI